MSSEPSNDPAKSYLDTLEHDPFGLLAGMTPASQSIRPMHAFLAHSALAEDIQRTNS